MGANSSKLVSEKVQRTETMELNSYSPVPGVGLKTFIAYKTIEKATKKINELNKKRKCKRGPGAMYFVWLSLIILVALAGIAAFVYVFSNLKV